MTLKVSVVGGGSTYTPELVEGLVTFAERLPVDELALFDVDGERLEVVGSFARRILAGAGLSEKVTMTTDRTEALEGSRFVIVQLRVGGQRARLMDETIPLRHGCIGQETTGAGGFAKALRTVPLVIELAEDVARLAAPGAWLIDFTNPVGIVTQALLDADHRAVGLCNVAIGLQKRLAALLGVDPGEVELEHVGLNHLSWERAVRIQGEDRLPEILERHGEWVAGELHLPVDLIQELGMIPSYYLRYFYATDQVLAEQLQGRTRAEEVLEIERSLLDLYRDPELRRKPDLLEQRGGAFYSEAAIRLISSLYSGSGDVQVVDVRNEGALPGFAADAVVEIPAAIGAGGAVPVSLAPLQPEILGLAQHVKAYERLAVEASLSGSRSVALKALMTNPLVGTHARASALLDDLLEANRSFLPRFFPRDAAVR